MIVQKYGGTSVGTAARMRDVLSIVTSTPDSKIVVLSAMSGTTNDLVTYNDLLRSDLTGASAHLELLRERYNRVIREIGFLEKIGNAADRVVEDTFSQLSSCLHQPLTEQIEKANLAVGELLSTQLFHLLCQSEGHSSELLPALDFMRIDEGHEPDIPLTQKLLAAAIKAKPSVSIFITQGYICRDHQGHIDNLQRGGSDYTATIIGAAIQAKEIQIWTDIDGVHNNDPRLVDDTAPIRQMSYREAAELAYFGAKILHPTCVLPAERMQVPLRLKHTMNPNAPGTLISDQTSQRAITAIAAKDGITAIKIYSHRMLMAYGFLRKVFQVFEDHETPVDMITTSEVAVSVTIDDISRLDDITMALSDLGEVQARGGYSIICIVGNSLYDDGQHLNAIFGALKDIPTRMISLGGSRYNVSILLKTEYKKDALIRLNGIF